METISPPNLPQGHGQDTCLLRCDEGTPKIRNGAMSHLSSRQKMRVEERENSLIQGLPADDKPIRFCVVTHATDEMTIIEFAHVVDPKTPSEELDQLEWSWNMKHLSFNINTRFNIYTLNITLHGSLDLTAKNKPVGWLWLPTDMGILARMEDHYARGRFEGQKASFRRDPNEFYGGKTRFEYKLTALSDMRKSWEIRRYHDMSKSFVQPSKRQSPPYTQHFYPFRDLGNISLHVPFHFAIVDTGRKLEALYNGHVALDSIMFDFPFLDSFACAALKFVYDIYHAWMTAPIQLTEGTFLPEKTPAGDPDASGNPEDGGEGKGVIEGSGAEGSQKEGEHQRHEPSYQHYASRTAHFMTSATSLRPWDSSSNRTPKCRRGQEDSDSEDEMEDEDEDSYDLEEERRFHEGVWKWAEDVQAIPEEGRIPFESQLSQDEDR